MTVILFTADFNWTFYTGYVIYTLRVDLEKGGTIKPESFWGKKSQMFLLINKNLDIDLPSPENALIEQEINTMII